MPAQPGRNLSSMAGDTANRETDDVRGKHTLNKKRGRARSYEENVHLITSPCLENVSMDTGQPARSLLLVW